MKPEISCLNCQNKPCQSWTNEDGECLALPPKWFTDWLKAVTDGHGIIPDLPCETLSESIERRR